MSIKNYKNLFKEISQTIREFDLNSVTEKLNNFQLQDLKNINYKRLFYDVKSSKYSKPIIGFMSASLLSVFVLIPKIQFLNSSFKKIELYTNQSKQLDTKLSQLKLANQKFKEISKLMTAVNSSVFKKEQTIFISRLLNEAAKKSNVKISYFSPILKADTGNLCKSSLTQKNSKKFKRRRKSKSSRKGPIQEQFFEVNFNSDYMDIITFLREIQIYDIVIISHCLEVDSGKQIVSKNTNENLENDSLLIPLNQSGNPIASYTDITKLDNSQNIGNVSTRIVFKIPSYQK